MLLVLLESFPEIPRILIRYYAWLERNPFDENPLGGVSPRSDLFTFTTTVFFGKVAKSLQ